MRKKNRMKIIIILLVVISIFNPFSLEKMVTYLDNITNNDGLRFILNGSDSIEASGNLISDEEASKLNKTSLTGDNYQFDVEYYPYYGLLNDNEKKLYKQIYANINAVNTEFVPAMDVSVEEVKETFEAVYNDHPELFWVNTSYSYKYTASNRCVEIVLSYNETVNDLEKHKYLFNQATSKIINQASKFSSNYEKEKYVHDYLIDSITYDKSADMHQSAYSAIVNKKSICAGYTRAFQYIMIQLKIPTYYCVGVASVNHAWNIVKLEDRYYNVDLTWDDTETNRYKYFNRTDNDFVSTHKRTGLSTYLPKCVGNKYSYKSNTLTSNKGINNSTVSSNSTIQDNDDIDQVTSDFNEKGKKDEEKDNINENGDIILDIDNLSNINRKEVTDNGEDTIIDGGD